MKILVLLFVLACGDFASSQVTASGDFDKAFGGAPVKAGRWHLQSNLLVNLHQRLLYQARFKDNPPALITGDGLAKWNAAVEAYRIWLGKRDPIEDAELVAMNEKLSASKGEKLPKDIPTAAAKVLNDILPVYQALQWPSDDAMNRFCIAAAAPLVESAGEELALAHARVYGVTFPTKILVDVTALGWQFGAYTVGTGEHAHVIFQAPDNPAAQGQMALESLLHEPTHVFVGSRTDAIGGDLTRLSKELGLRPMANLWHAILFYTSGELTRQAYAKRGVLDYKPIIKLMYAGAFRGYQQSLETHWQDYIDGKVSKDDALRQILIETSPKPKG